MTATSSAEPPVLTSSVPHDRLSPVSKTAQTPRNRQQNTLESGTARRTLESPGEATWIGDKHENREWAVPSSRPELAYPIFGAALNAVSLTGKRKRRHSQGSHISNTNQRTPKRIKSSSSTSDSTGTLASGLVKTETETTSPLFFSHTPRSRPQLPRFSSSEAGATMMDRVNADENTTPSLLQRIKINRSSVQRSGSGTKLSPSQHARSRPPKSDEAEIHAKGLQAISHIGVQELLEQDDRLVFIIDLSNRHNFAPGPLGILFANATLKGVQSVYEAVQGHNTEDARTIITGLGFPEFKAWAISFVEEDQAMNVTLPAYAYGGAVWTSVNLRSKFRVFYGSISATSSRMTSTGPRWQSPLIGSQVNGQSPSTASLGRVQDDVSDYFGTVKLQHSRSPGSDQHTLDDVNRAALLSEDPVNQLLNRSANGSRNALTIPSAGTPGPPPLAQPTLSLEDLQQHGQDRKFQHPLGLGSQKDGFLDWTRLPLTSALPKHIQFAKSVNWAVTSLGPAESWPPVLTSFSNLLMASPHPTAMYWGDDNVAIYNEPYILLAGQKHPKLMGQTYIEAWGEIWNFVKDSFTIAKETGQSVMKDDDLLFVNRQGFLEETYFSWSLIPILGSEGKVCGLFNPAFEKTRRKIAERRMLTLREVGETIASAREVKSFWSQVLKGLEINEYDVPFVLLYSVGEENDSDSISMQSGSTATAARSCYLEGALPELPEGHPIAPPVIDLRFGTDGFAAAFRDAAGMDRPILLETSMGTLNPQLLEGFECRGFPEKPRAAIVCPIQPTTGDNIIGFLVMGVNPRRPYDDDYSLFIQLLSRQLATSMASVVLFEEEIKRGQRAAKLAALDRIELSEQLAARTLEAVESENKFTRMAELAPVGMFIANQQGKMMFTNDTFHKISGYSNDPNLQDTWMDSIMDDDRPALEHTWQRLIDQGEPISAEFRFKTLWEDPNGAKSDTWVLASAYPEKDDQGGLKTVFGSITDISQQKWAQDFQKKRTEEAVELKRQQSNFIDMTSHEMRNPLSAILQCADEITRSLSDFKAHPSSYALPTDLLDSNIDAAQTITLCANHQTRIVSDVLTLSKLDSALLLVTPVDVRPANIVQQALKMFDGELQTADIKMEFQVDSSLDQLDVEWVRLDPSRLLQVLINLTTNAIKFTSSQAKRTITIGLSASLVPPSKLSPSLVSYIPSRSKRGDITEGKDWGTGDPIYLSFAVQDTGKGLTEDERKLLFLRFSQASPKTHVQYGGSGLGLFISRELVELQGGEIGVLSESGKGSTFAFYVKARRSNGPPDGTEEMPALSLVNSRKSTTNRNSKIQDPEELPKLPVVDRPSPPKPLQDMRVMIVEDNLVNQRVLSKALGNQGCIVSVANHGEECLDQLHKTRFWKGHEQDGSGLAVVLMDLEMPVMDGLTCTRTIRELQAKGDIVQHVPIIAVSANARSAHVESALAAGMDDVVSKPFRIPELIPKMQQLAAKYKTLT